MMQLTDIESVWRIRIRMDPEMLPESRSQIIVPDPDPAKCEKQINNLFISL